MTIRISRHGLALILLCSLAATSASAYELRLERHGTPGYENTASWGAHGYNPSIVSYGASDPSFDLYLDTQGESGIVGFEVSLTFAAGFGFEYEPGLSHLEDYYPLYAPGEGKAAATWLVPLPGSPLLSCCQPGGYSQIEIAFIETNLNATTATATNLYLGTIAFSIDYDFLHANHYEPDEWDTRVQFGFEGAGNYFIVNGEEIGGDVSTAVSWATVPEPGVGVLMGLGLAGLGARRKR